MHYENFMKSYGYFKKIIIHDLNELNNKNINLSLKRLQNFAILQLKLGNYESFYDLLGKSL
mgnify:CR=1 FL=1